jgi:type II secretion system protein G
MRYRCPYCQADLSEPPRDGHCGACGRVMRVPPSTSAAAERAARRRRRERILLAAEQQRMRIRSVPSARALYSPKVLFAVMLVFAVVGGSLVRRANPLPRARQRLPHQVALQHLDTLATALGRYRFHVGAYPATTPGLRALLNNYGTPGWNGPYINQLRNDPWRTPFQYARQADGTVRLFACGPDRRPDTPDDLRPDPAAFDPGTAWTNGWVRAIHRQPGALIMRREWIEPAAGNPP